VTVTGFKKCCISDEMNAMEYKEEAGDVGNEHQTEDGKCEDNEGEQ
jgi:hypothetical protein